MELTLSRAWDDDITKYKSVLDKFNATYSENNTFAYVTIEDLSQLFKLAKELEYDLIIEHLSDAHNEITIYDDYIE